MQWLSSTLGRKNSNTQQPQQQRQQQLQQQQQQQQQPHNPIIEEEEDQQYEHDHDEYDYDDDGYDHDEYGHDHGGDDDEYDERVVAVDDDVPPPGVGRPGPPPPPTVGPPPTTGPPISSSSTTATTTPPRNLSDLTRPKRPIDPVFRSGVQYATFSKGGGGGRGQPSHQAPSSTSSSINVFIPSSKVAAVPASSLEGVVDEEEIENYDDEDEGGESMQQQHQKRQVEENPMEEGDTYYGGEDIDDGDNNAPPVGPGTETETETFEKQEQEGDPHYYYHHHNHDEIGPTAEEDDGKNYTNNYYNGQHSGPDQSQYDENMEGGGDRDVLEEEGGRTYEASNALKREFDVSQPGQAQGYNINKEEEGYDGINNGDGGPDDDKECNSRGDHYISDDGTDDDDDDDDQYEYDVDNVDRSMVDHTDENGQEKKDSSENIVAVPEEDADVNPPSTPAAAAGDDTSTSYETPARSQQQHELQIAVEEEKPTPSSRFVFLSDQKRLPTDLRRLQERTLKRRRELLTRMHDLDCQAARLASQLADEQMDFHLAIHDSFERTVQRPLTSAMERITIDKDSSSNPMIVRSLERRLCDIDVGMTRHVHETMCEAKRDKLESIHDGLQQGIVSELRMENIKYDKVEGGIVRRFEQVAGSLASDFQKEAAERRGQTELLRRKVELTAKVEATERLQHKLVLIQSLREQLKSERAERRQSDQRIHTEINESKVRIERAMLAAFETEL